MKRYIRVFFEVIITVIIFSAVGMICHAAVEIGENYVMYDMRQYDGDSALPYGRGSNADCYYPRKDDADYVFPELYTWSYATLSETDDGVRLYGTKTDSLVSITVDKVPPMYQQSVQRDFCFFVMRIKANTTGVHTVTFSSLGGYYRKEFAVEFTGDWQKIVLDLSGSDGWKQKKSDGTYSEMTSAPWDNGYFGPDGFAIIYPSFGQDVKNDIYIDYYAFTDNADTELKTGKLVREEAYVSGKDDGLFYPSELLTRAEGYTMVSRLVGGDDYVIPQGYVSRFEDVSESDWFYPYVAQLDCMGALSRHSGSLLPNECITKAELCACLIAANAADGKAGRLGYSDNTMLLSEDAAEGYGEYITRAETCVLINSVTGRASDLENSGLLQVSFPDVTDDIWAYDDIISASISKDVKMFSDGTSEIITVLDKADYDKTAEKTSETDKKAEALKNSIRNSKTEIVPQNSEKCYYVSPDGDDSNSGESPDSPWRTLHKVNLVGFTAGSTVYFERGGLWRGSLRILPNVTYTAYGEGEKPTFYGSLYDGADEALWTLVDGTTNIWKFKYDMLDCGSVVFNHGEYHSDKETPSYNGTVYLHRNSSRVFDFKTDISENLGIFCDNKRELTAECPLYLRCDEGNPGALFDSIEFMPRQNILSVVANQNATIDNFRIMYGGAHGIGAGTIKNFRVQNCEFYWIGGSVHTYSTGGGIMAVRYGNAIESYGAQDGYYVENNYIHQVYDAGITHQMSGGSQENGIQKNIRYANNLIEFCSYSVEYFLGAGVDGTPQRYMENVIIEDNIMRYAGFGFGNQRTDRLCMSHIKSGRQNAVSEGFTIRNNIFDRSREMLLCIGADKAEDLPTLSGNTYIQYETTPETPYSTLGKYGENPARLRFFSRDIKAVLGRISAEENADVYFAPRDWLYELEEY